VLSGPGYFNVEETPELANENTKASRGGRKIPPFRGG
jgi:hypothetical protein